MSVPAPKFETVQQVPPPPYVQSAAAILPLPRRGSRSLRWLGEAARQVASTVVPPLLVLAVLLAVWELLMAGQTGGLPAPTTIWLESKELILDPFYDRGGVDKGLFWHVATSLSRVGVGFGLAAVVGIALGALREADPSALFVIFITSIWPIIINTAVGVRNLPVDYVNVSRTLSLSPIEHFWKVLLPATTPYIFTGLRIGIGMSWLAIVASEMLLGGVGVGFFIWDQYNASP